MFGFISVDTSLLSLNEQIRLFFKASVIVSPHGAGWANMVFSPSAKILEIISGEYYSPTNWLLANVLGHSYFQLVTTQQRGKFVVDLNRLRCLLEEMLEST
jgi:capsular polysaccharide biosynthesis protein